MAADFVIMYEPFYGDSDKPSPECVMLSDGEKVTIHSADEGTLEQWTSYFTQADSWKVHAKAEYPLQSLFGRSTYFFGSWKPYDKDSKALYDEMVKKVGGKPTVVSPK